MYCTGRVFEFVPPGKVLRAEVEIESHFNRYETHILYFRLDLWQAHAARNFEPSDLGVRD